MNRLLSISIRRLLKTKLKTVEPESYVKFNKDTKPHVKRTLEDLKKEAKIYSAATAKRVLTEKFEPVPISPTLGPIEVLKPVIGKTIKWCSCGMSTRQPYCDNSHEGTAFSPVEFKIEEPVHGVLYCGCKFSTEAPFCDKLSCLKLQGQDPETLAKKKLKEQAKKKLERAKNAKSAAKTSQE